MTRRPEIQIRMTPDERSLFEKAIEAGPSYLEFGCGGSTELAVAANCKIIVSVESDPTWVEKLSEKPQIAQSVDDGRLRFRIVDIGPTGDWGYPKDDSSIRNWPKYCLAPFGQSLDFEFVLVDGRFRKACALASWAFLGDDAVLAIHDYSNRTEYYDIERFFDLIESAGTLFLFKKKKNIVQQSYITTLLGSIFDPS